MTSTKPKSRKVTRRRPQKRTIETRLKIIRAALAEFADLGFEGASTRGIADAAEVPHSLVIYHFRNKEQLWYETVKEVAQWYSETPSGVPEPMTKGDPAHQLKHNFSHFIRFSANYPEFSRMITRGDIVASKRLTWYVTNYLGPTVAYTTELIRRAQKMGAFVEGDPLTLLYLFLGMATSPYRSAREIELLTGQQPYAEESIRRHIDLCERLFFRAVPKKNRTRSAVRCRDTRKKSEAKS